VRGEQTYCFVVRGRRLDRLEDVLQATAIRTDTDQANITATIIDQSHLRAVLHSIRDFELQLLALERLGPVAATNAAAGKQL
jgi:hypothetical protein